MISLIADTERMNIKGTRVVNRPVGDTSGICWMGRELKKSYHQYHSTTLSFTHYD